MKEKEEERLQKMLEIEEGLYSKGIKLVCGVDEAGRGPLCGPVVAAAVILKPDSKIEGVNDSKKLSEKKREQVYEAIMQNALAVGVGISDVDVIESVNILNATKLAMKEAISKLKVQRIFYILVQAGLDNLEDSLLYAITYNTIINQENFDKIKNIV